MGMYYKILSFYVVAFISISCDTFPRALINNEKEVHISTGFGTAMLDATLIGNYSAVFAQKLNGTFLIQPDSLKFLLYPKSMGIKKITFAKGYNQRNDNKPFLVTNNDVIVDFLLSHETPIVGDTAKIIILPCNYIMCNGEPILKDTVIIYLVNANEKK